MRQNSKGTDDKGEISAANAAADPFPKRRLVLFALIASAGCALDLVTKRWIFQWPPGPGQRGEWWIIEHYLGIQKALNNGAVFGMGQGQANLFTALSVVAAVGIVVWLFCFRAARDLPLTIALACVMGGIIGNLHDRLGMHHLAAPYDRAVRDWILVCYYDHIWPNFNVADSLLVCGAVALAIHGMLHRDAKSSGK